VFAPSLLRGEDDGLGIRKIRAQCHVIENCILYHAVVFQEEDEEDGDEGDEEEEEAVVEGVDVRLLAAAASSVDHLNTDGPTMPLGSHDFKKAAFNPFHLVACQHCHKAILGLGQAYQCQGTSTKPPSVGVASGFRLSPREPTFTRLVTHRVRLRGAQKVKRTRGPDLHGRREAPTGHLPHVPARRQR
jgi:hypothetical protein